MEKKTGYWRKALKIVPINVLLVQEAFLYKKA